MSLNLSDGHRRKQLLLAGAAVAVIGVAIFAVVWSLRGPSLSARPDEVHFVCDKCGDHFLLRRRDLPKDYMRDRLTPEGPAGIDCPKCGGKGTAYMAVKCRNPECGAYYLTEWSRHPAGPAEENLRRGVHWDSKCPKCGTDPAEWDRKHGGK